MTIEAIIMLSASAVVIWGGLVAAIINISRSRPEDEAE